MPSQIRLIVNRQNDAYTAEWIESDGQRSDSFPLTLPLSADDLKELRWYLETYYQFPGAGDHAHAQVIESKLKAWGHALFDSIFGTVEGTNVYRNLMDADEPRKLIIGSTDPDLLSLPWEMMRDKRGPLAFQGVVILRQLTGTRRNKKFSFGLPLRVLLIVSRPRDIGFINPRNSIAPLLDVLDGLPPGQVQVVFCEPPTLSRLEKMISQARREKQPYHIVHFDGHGTYLPKIGVGELCFERDDESMQLVRGAKLGALMSRLDVPLVLLEACRGSDLSDRPVYGSVAPALLQSGVGSVVAFSHSVHVEAAKLLVERFYEELCAGASIGRAIEEARVALHATPARWLHRGPNAATLDLEDWFIPQLYQVGSDPVLISETALEATEQKEHTPPVFYDFPPPPLYQFHGRAPELLTLERAFRKHTAVVLTGMGGMGKTALSREAASWWLRKGTFEAAVFFSFERQAGAERVVQVLGQALEGDEFLSRPAAEQWSEAVKLFHKRKVLLVWDNFESTLPAFQAGKGALGFNSDARSLLHKLYRELTTPQRGKVTGRLLVTCRPTDTGLAGIKEMSLRGLARPDSLYLLAAVLDLKGISTDRPGYEREKVDDLLDALTDHPLSVELVAPHLKTLKPSQILADFQTLLDKFVDDTSFEGRNRSLLASLEFSKQHLSQAAQDALPYLAWFEGGVFEAFLLLFTELPPETWEPIRAELAATALVKVEDDLQVEKRPFLRFHPTLSYAAKREQVPSVEQAAQMYIQVYLGVRNLAHNALFGTQPAAAIALLTREEGNLHTAIVLVFKHGMHREGASMADTLREYLQCAGRLRERDALVSWVQEQMPKGEGLDGATCNAILDHAWSLFTQGQANEAVGQVQVLINRLESKGLSRGKDPAFQIALGYLYLGRIYLHAGRSDLAIEPLQKAIKLFERLDDQDDIAAVLGDMANVYRNLGRLDEALQTAERALEILRELNSDQRVASALTTIAKTLMEQQKYTEADARYKESMQAAQAAGNLEMQMGILQLWGSLQDSLKNYDRAIELYKEAIELFRQAGNMAEEMRTYNLLGIAEKHRGQLEAAEAWHARSRELAVQLQDQKQLAAIAQNEGLLYQKRAEQTQDAKERAVWLHQAVESAQESLVICLEMGNQVYAAAPYSQLGEIYRMLGNLDKAQEHALKSLQIRESLNLPNVYKDYAILALIAHAHGDTRATSEWQAKYEAKLAELEKRRRGK